MKFFCSFDPSRKVVKDFVEPSMTKQSFKDQCDVNNILKRYRNAGVSPYQMPQPGSYQNCLGVTDYQTALHQIREAEASFGALPAELRKRFDNDPGLFLDFVHDPSNFDEMVELGLANKPKSKVVEPVVESSL